MYNQNSNPETKAETLYNIAYNVAEDFLSVFSGEQISEVFTNSCFDELEVNKLGISRSELFMATSIVIEEILDKDKLNKQAKKAVQKLVDDSESISPVTV